LRINLDGRASRSDKIEIPFKTYPSMLRAKNKDLYSQNGNSTVSIDKAALSTWVFVGTSFINNSIVINNTNVIPSDFVLFNQDTLYKLAKMDYDPN
jgi:hypothetical protein